MGMVKGKIVRWVGNRGFGFIKPDNGKDDIFIHISAIEGLTRKPVIGDIISYEISVDGNNRPRAINARVEGGGKGPTLEKHKRKSNRSTPIRNRKTANVKKSSNNYKLLLILLAIIIGVGIYALQKKGVDLIPSYQEQASEADGSQEKQAPEAQESQLLTRAYENQQSDLQVSGSGIVIKVLSDDTRGSQHQRFLLKLPSGQTLLIAHNIDLAPRINSLREGDVVEFYGEYEWNSKGGVLHWTHHDPRGDHVNGWLKHKGSTYQ